MKFSSLIALGLLSSLCSVQAQDPSDAPSTSSAPSDAPSNAPSNAPSRSPSVSMSPSVQPTLASYEISFSNECAFVADNVTKIGTINCGFTASGPQDFGVGGAIYGSDGSTCSGTAPDGVALVTATPRSPVGSIYTESINIGFNAFEGLTADSEAQNITFCLEAEVTDNADVVYKEVKKVITLSITYDDTFTSAGLTAVVYDPNQGTDSVDSNLAYTVDARRCDQFGETVSGNLEIGDNFFLCVQGDPTSVLVTEIETLTASKGDSLSLQLIGGESSGANAQQYGKGSNILIIGIRLPASFYTGAGDVTFTGEAAITVGSNRRQLVRIMQEDQTLDFSVEVGVESVSSAVSVSMFGAAIVTSAVVALVL